MRHVKVDILTDEAFAPYGRLLGTPARDADLRKDWLSYWHDLAEIGFRERPVWGFLEVRSRPVIIDVLERHCAAHEVFIPIGDGVSVMPFAVGGAFDDAKAAPDPATLRVFLVDGSCAFVVDRGVWHAPSFALGEKAGFLLALEHATPNSDIDVRPFGPCRVSL